MNVRMDVSSNLKDVKHRKKGDDDGSMFSNSWVAVRYYVRTARRYLQKTEPSFFTFTSRKSIFSSLSFCLLHLSSFSVFVGSLPLDLSSLSSLSTAKTPSSTRRPPPPVSRSPGGSNTYGDESHLGCDQHNASRKIAVVASSSPRASVARLPCSTKHEDYALHLLVLAFSVHVAAKTWQSFNR
jgi:hypothetical protein